MLIMVLTTFRRLLLVLVAYFCWGAPAVANSDPEAPQAKAQGPLRIGVLAYRGADQARREWQPHADYLAARLAPRQFRVVPLTLAEFAPAIAERRIDLMVTNTGHYVELEVGGRISRIATMRVPGPNGPVDRFGGTAIARAEREDLKTYADLRGKRGEVMPPWHEWTLINSFLQYEGFGETVIRQAGPDAETDPEAVLSRWGKPRLVASVEGIRFYAPGGR